MKVLNKILMGLTVTAVLASCGKEETTTKTNPNELSSNITSDRTLESGQVYTLNGRVAVTAGATLTIEPGVIIKATEGAAENASALIIARGAKIMAEGTATEPIIFTTTADAIEPGMIASPNLNATDNAYWGGLIVLGKARGSFEGNVSEFAIDGIPATDENGKYGGSDDNDNSGVIKYVSIRHGGASIGDGNEINGLTLGCVGRETVIENVEVVGNQDDGIEWFGGTVNVTNAIVWNAGDDAIDTDQAWSGTLNNFVIINPGDEGFELDGPEGSFEGPGHTITNGTMIAQDASGLIDLDDNSDLFMSNIYFTNVKEGQDLEGFDANPSKNEVGFGANTKGYFITNFEITLPTTDNNGNPKTYTKQDFFGEAASSNVAATNVATVGANFSMLKSWSFTGQTSTLLD